MIVKDFLDLKSGDWLIVVICHFGGKERKLSYATGYNSSHFSKQLLFKNILWFDFHYHRVEIHVDG